MSEKEGQQRNLIFTKIELLVQDLAAKRGVPDRPEIHPQNPSGRSFLQLQLRRNINESSSVVDTVRATVVVKSIIFTDVEKSSCSP